LFGSKQMPRQLVYEIGPRPLPSLYYIIHYSLVMVLYDVQIIVWSAWLQNLKTRWCLRYAFRRLWVRILARLPAILIECFRDLALSSKPCFGRKGRQG
jgi:hypothetical protein